MERYPWAGPDMEEVLEWRHPSFYLAHGWPLYIDIEREHLDVIPKRPAPGIFADGDPVTHDTDGTALSESSRQEIGWIRRVQREASARAVEVLHALDLRVTQPLLRGFLHRLAFAQDPLKVEPELIAKTFEDISSNTAPDLLAKLPFPIPKAPHWSKPYPRKFGHLSASVQELVLPNASNGLEPTPEQVWAREVLIITTVRIAHTRLLATRREFLRLDAQDKIPSRTLFREGLDISVRAALGDGQQSRRDTMDVLVGKVAAECSPWWRDRLEWDLLRGDRAFEPRGSYLSPDDAPKQLYVWHVFDYWIRKALKDLPTHLDRSRAIAATLAVFAGPALYHPPDLEQFARNIVERWRTRKAARSDQFARERFRSGISPFSFLGPRRST